MTMVASSFFTSAFSSATFPSPMRVRGLGEGRFCRAIPTTVPPAVSTKASSSSMVSSSALSRRSSLGLHSPASTARSRGMSVSFCFGFCVCLSSIEPLCYVIILDCRSYFRMNNSEITHLI